MEQVQLLFSSSSSYYLEQMADEQNTYKHKNTCKLTCRASHEQTPSWGNHPKMPRKPTAQGTSDFLSLLSSMFISIMSVFWSSYILILTWTVIMKVILKYKFCSITCFQRSVYIQCRDLVIAMKIFYVNVLSKEKLLELTLLESTLWKQRCYLLSG
jgi:hypothetical protein